MKTRCSPQRGVSYGEPQLFNHSLAAPWQSRARGPPLAPRAGASAIKRLTQGHVFSIRRRVHAVQHSGGSCWSNWSGYNAGYLAREELRGEWMLSLRAWGRNRSPAKLGDARHQLRARRRPSWAWNGGKKVQGRWTGSGWDSVTSRGALTHRVHWILGRNPTF